MDVCQMYENFQIQFPEASRAADARHLETWDDTEPMSGPIWFESLAGAINNRMGVPQADNEIAEIFKFFDMALRTGTPETRKCIEVSLVENLFWQVPPGRAARGWAVLPKNLQTLYERFHGQPPAIG